MKKLNVVIDRLMTVLEAVLGPPKYRKAAQYKKRDKKYGTVVNGAEVELFDLTDS